MMQVNKESTHRDASSYVDPNGFVFHHDNEIYRAISKDKSQFYKEIVEEGWAEELSKEFSLVPTRFADLQFEEDPDQLVLKHQKVQPLTYCVEWPPSKLKEAALQLLELSMALLKKNCILQDAYPWNSLFDGVKPVFVDFTSIVEIDPDSNIIWPALSQFKSFFQYPLELAQIGKGNLARQLLFNQTTGISYEDYYRNISATQKFFRPQLALESFINNRIQNSPTLKKKVKNSMSGNQFKITNEMRMSFFKKLHKKISSYQFAAGGEIWDSYYQDINPNFNKKKKIEVIDDILKKLKPSRVLDLGCNTGVFSVLAARHGIPTISVDSSEKCAERLFKTAREEELPINPLLMDVLSPTPAFGFLGKQFAGFVERGRSELVMCLGLMHHLHIAGRQPFWKLAEMMSELSTKHLIFEYVDLKDDNNELLNLPREIKYGLESVKFELSRFFPKIEIMESDRNTRQMLVCSK